MEQTTRQALVGISVLIRRGGKLLLGKRKGSHGAGEYESPGGHLEFGESFGACIRREVLEETGLLVTRYGFIRVHNTLAYAPRQYVDLAFEAEVLDGEPVVTEPDKIESWDWYEPDALPSPLFATMLTTIKSLQTGQMLWDCEPDQ